MSVIPQIVKENKTDDWTAYYKEYRAKNAGKLSSKDATKYYKKKYGLEPHFVEKYGEYSGEMYKLQQLYKKLIEKCPELKPHIIQEFQEVQEP